MPSLNSFQRLFVASAALWLAAGAQASPASQATPPADPRPVLATYAELAYRAYSEAHQKALHLQAAVDEFVGNPGGDSEEALNRVRQAWLDARPSYGRTEALRFYEGPIDFGKRPDGTEGPEPLINAWPLNESYIDSVRDNPRAGIINDPSVPITRATLVERNARDDEADVTTGYHAIEFLLWGQDFNAGGPGNRPARDFVGAGAAQRRRAYLKVATDLLVENLGFVVDEWAPGKDNYRARFLALDPRESIAHILTGMATLAGFEVAAERLATPLDSGSQEDEHSCFSDTTDLDIRANVAGIANLYFGRGTNYRGAGLETLLGTLHPEINARITEALAASQKLVAAMDHPFDRTLATPPGSPQRARVESLITSLQTLARLFQVAGRVLGVNIVVTVEVEH